MNPAGAGPPGGTWTRWNRLRYTGYAPLYDLLVSRLPLFRRGRQRALALAHLQPGERVLLVAAGTGLDLPALPPTVAVTASDLTPAMLRRLVRRARRLGRPVRADVMDAARLAYRDASFDCVVLHLALAVVPDPVATIREAARVLRPGGRVSIFDKFLADGDRPSLLRRLVGALARVVATDLNRQLGPLLQAGGLVLRHREIVGPGGLFIVARADKPGSRQAGRPSGEPDGPSRAGGLVSAGGPRKRGVLTGSAALRTRLATPLDAAAIATIYNEGLQDRVATFETAPREAAAVAAQLAEKGDRYPTVVVERDGRVVAWAGAGPYRARPAYAGVAEHSVYVARSARGTGAGRAALLALAREYEARGFWKLLSRIFPENVASLALHERAGFRVVGVYRRHGRLDGRWRDCVIVEKLLDPATEEPGGPPG